jgi:hypothetical protein
VRVPERLSDLRVHVRRVEDVLVEIGADRHGAEREIPELNQRISREPSLRDGVVLELEIGRELRQLGASRDTFASSSGLHFAIRVGQGPIAVEPNRPASVVRRLECEPRRSQTAAV